MGKGDQQFNRVLGEASIALFFGRKVEYRIPADPGSVHPISPNQYDELVAAGMAAGAPGYVEYCIARLEWQASRGHCCKARKSEFLSDSHAPIEYRAQSIGLWAARRSDHPRAGELVRRYLQWWAREVYSCNQLLVPSGPHAGSIVGLGGRYQDGWDETRDVCQALITGRDHGKPGAFFDRSASRQDTFPALVVRHLVANGAFDGLEPEEPFLPFPYRVRQCLEGHECSAPAGWSNQPGDPDSVAVRYRDGRIVKNATLEGLGDVRFQKLMGRKEAA